MENTHAHPLTEPTQPGMLQHAWLEALCALLAALFGDALRDLLEARAESLPQTRRAAPVAANAIRLFRRLRLALRRARITLDEAVIVWRVRIHFPIPAAWALPESLAKPTSRHWRRHHLR